MRIEDYISQLNDQEATAADEAVRLVHASLRTDLGAGHELPGDDRLAEIEHTIARYIVEARS